MRITFNGVTLLSVSLTSYIVIYSKKIGHAHALCNVIFDIIIASRFSCISIYYTYQHIYRSILVWNYYWKKRIYFELYTYRLANTIKFVSFSHSSCWDAFSMAFIMWSKILFCLISKSMIAIICCMMLNLPFGCLSFGDSIFYKDF